MVNRSEIIVLSIVLISTALFSTLVFLSDFSKCVAYGRGYITYFSYAGACQLGAFLLDTQPPVVSLSFNSPLNITVDDEFQFFEQIDFNPYNGQILSLNTSQTGRELWIPVDSVMRSAFLNFTNNELVTYLSFDEGSGNISRDFVGNRNATLSSNSWITGRIGNASNAGVTLTNDLSITTGSTNSSSTVVFWRHGTIFSLYSPPGSVLQPGHLAVHVGSGGSFLTSYDDHSTFPGRGPTFDIEFRESGGGGTVVGRARTNFSADVDAYNAAGWKQIAVTFTGIGGGLTNISFYLNGTFVGSNITNVVGTFDNINRIAVGDLSGGVDEFLFFNRSLTANEISTLYTSPNRIVGVENASFAVSPANITSAMSSFLSTCQPNNLSFCIANVSMLGSGTVYGLNMSYDYRSGLLTAIENISDTVTAFVNNVTSADVG